MVDVKKIVANDLVRISEKLLLTNDPQDYAFLNKSRTTIDGVNDVAEWKLLKVRRNPKGPICTELTGRYLTDRTRNSGLFR